MRSPTSGTEEEGGPEEEVTLLPSEDSPTCVRSSSCGWIGRGDKRASKGTCELQEITALLLARQLDVVLRHNAYEHKRVCERKTDIRYVVLTVCGVYPTS